MMESSLTNDCHGDASCEGDLAAKDGQGEQDAADSSEDSRIGRNS